jgi:hypothetical protein
MIFLCQADSTDFVLQESDESVGGEGESAGSAALHVLVVHFAHFGEAAVGGLHALEPLQGLAHHAGVNGDVRGGGAERLGHKSGQPEISTI